MPSDPRCIHSSHPLFPFSPNPLILSPPPAATVHCCLHDAQAGDGGVPEEIQRQEETQGETSGNALRFYSCKNDPSGHLSFPTLDFARWIWWLCSLKTFKLPFWCAPRSRLDLIINLPIYVSSFLSPFSSFLHHYFPSFPELQGAILTTLLVTRNFSGMFLSARCPRPPGLPKHIFWTKSIHVKNKQRGGCKYFSGLQYWWCGELCSEKCIFSSWGKEIWGTTKKKVQSIFNFSIE